jgi:arylsulfatase A-like enzyme
MRLLQLWIVLATCAAGPFSLTQAAGAQRPNIILILADDLGYSDLGCYGGEIETPNLDRLAAAGLRFTQAYNTARCWPTRAALLTGYYAQQVHRDAIPGLGGGSRGMRQSWARLAPDFLRPYGYRSYHSGKWHLDGKVLDGGFDRSLNVANQGNYFSARGNLIDDVPVSTAGDESGYYATNATIDHAISCLREHDEKYSTHPFFQYVAFIAPHFPLHALPEDIARYRDRYFEGWEGVRKTRHAKQQTLGLLNSPLSPLEPDIGPPYDFPEAIRKLGPGETNRPLPWSELTDQQRRFQANKMAIHAAMVYRMDREIGRLIAALEEMDALANTMIIFASDNGASAEIMVRDGGHDPNAPLGSAATYACLGPGFSSACNTPFRRHKTWVHEGGISTPLIIHWPAGIEAKGGLRTSPIHMIDVLPTILEVAGAEKPATWEGESIPPAPGRSITAAFERDVVIERDGLWWFHEGHRAMRIGDWKLVAAKGDPWELYNLESDRSETNNLATERPDKVEELKLAWNARLAEFSELAAKTAAGNSNAATRKAKARDKSKTSFQR